MEEELTGLLEHPKNRTEITALMKELLEHLGMQQTVKAIERHCTLEAEEEPFEDRLRRLEQADYRSEVERRQALAQFLEKEYIARIEKEQIHSALDLLSGPMTQYCSNLERLSTYLLCLPKKQPRLLKIMAPYMLKQRCPELPKHRVLRVVFEEDQVWLVKARGRLIVAIDKKANAKVIIEEGATYKIHAQLKTLHKKAVTCLTWKNDKEFGTASDDATAKIWSDKLQCLKLIEYHTCRVSAIAFTADSIITAGFDKIVMCDYRQSRKQEVVSRKVYDMLVTRDGKYLLTLTCNKYQINIIGLDNMSEVASIKEKHMIASMALSRNEKYLFVNTSFSRPAIHVWTMPKPQLVQKWTGHYQEKYILRMDSGGPFDQFLAIGSERGEVLLFHISQQFPVHRIVACRNKPVNCVSWIDSGRLVECNDDRSVQSTEEREETRIVPPVESRRRQLTREEVIRMMMMPHTIFNNDDESDTSV